MIRRPIRWVFQDPRFACSRPCFSPDGTRVLFMRAPRASGSPVRDNEGPWALWTIGLDGGGPVLVFESASVVATRPDWSATSGRIAFTGIRDGRPELWITEAEGRDARALSLGAPPHTRLFYPSWYPDGRRLVVTDYSRHQVLEVDVDGETVRALTEPSRVLAGMAAPWCDGKGNDRIAFAGQLPGEPPFDPGRNRIWVQDPARGPRLVDGRPGRMPAWAPGGDRLAFTARRWRLADGSRLSRALRPPSTVYLQRIGAEGEGVGPPRPLSPVGVHAAHARWSPDGTLLVAGVGRRGRGSAGIAILRP